MNEGDIFFAGLGFIAGLCTATAFIMASWRGPTTGTDKKTRVEIRHATWSAPSVKALQELRAHLPEGVELVVLDHDALPEDPAFQGRGECRINDGPWTTYEDVLAKVR